MRHHKTSIVFYVSLGNNFSLFFCGGPLVVEAPGQLPSLPPPLKSGLYLMGNKSVGEVPIVVKKLSRPQL